MLVIDDSPWYIGMGWAQGLGFLSHLHFILNALSTSRAFLDRTPVESISLRAFLSTGSPVVGISFQANNKWEGLGIKIVFLDGTSFNQVSLTFSFSMLAGESPAGSILDSFGISVGVKVEVTNFPEILNHKIDTLVWEATFNDLSMNCWQYGHNDS